MGKFSRRTSVKTQPSGHSRILVGGWWFIFSNLSSWIRDAYCLEICREEEIWEWLLCATNPGIKSHLKGKHRPSSNYNTEGRDILQSCALGEGPTYKYHHNDWDYFRRWVQWHLKRYVPIQVVHQLSDKWIKLKKDCHIILICFVWQPQQVMMCVGRTAASPPHVH